MDGAADHSPVIYTGNSMRGTFASGETLELDGTTFESLRPGDVVVMFDRNPYVVHRIIGKNADSAVTMGDNNGRPDAWKLTPDGTFRLVTAAVSLNGTFRAVAGGEAGMRQFRRRQRIRKLHRFAGCLVSPLKPLKFLRIPARSEAKFRDGTVQWSYGRIPVAARSPKGGIRYLHWSKRLFFRVPETMARSACADDPGEGRGGHES